MPSRRRSQEFPEGTPTAEAAATAIGCSLAQIVKSIVFVCDGAVVLALVPGDRRADEAKVAAAAGAAEPRGSRTRARCVAATGFEPGAVAPFRLPAVAASCSSRRRSPIRASGSVPARRRTWPDSRPAELQRLTGARAADLVAQR